VRCPRKKPRSQKRDLDHPSHSVVDESAPFRAARSSCSVLVTQPDSVVVNLSFSLNG
jgi:hypothetical protein